MNRLILAIVILLHASFTSAQEPTAQDTPLAVASQEAKARAIFHQLRCEVCAGQSIADSGAPLAVDMRNRVRQEIADGKDEQHIIRFFVERYGDDIWLNPPVAPRTWLLWAAPLLGLLLGALALARFFRNSGARV